jgi:hypothetical protein
LSGVHGASWLQVLRIPCILPGARSDPQRRLDLGGIEDVSALDDHGNL